MNILVIGSKGFIGTHVVNYFSKEKGYACWGCDVIEESTAGNYFLVSATNSDFDTLFKNQVFDVCINCSGTTDVPDSFVHPFQDFTINTYNVAKILEAIRVYAPKCRFLNLSSAAIYGNSVNLPSAETDPSKPYSPHGLHKSLAEQLCNSYAHHFNIKTCSLRLFYAYGPGLKKYLLWDVYNKAKLGNEVKLLGTGEETRDFIYIDDVVRAIDTILQKGNFFAGIYNIASGAETTVNEAATTLLSQIGFTGTVSYNGKVRFGDPLRWKADTSSLTVLGYKPTIDVMEGIGRYVKWMDEVKM